MRLGDGVGVALRAVVFGQGAVDAGGAGVLAPAFAGGDDQVLRLSSMDSPFARRPDVRAAAHLLLRRWSRRGDEEAELSVMLGNATELAALRPLLDSCRS